MKNLLLILLAICFVGPAFAQKTDKEILDQFFNLYKDSPETALNYIYDTTPWIDSQGESVLSLKEKLKLLSSQIGNYNGAEFIAKASLGQSFSTYIYMAKYDRQPLRFTFEFYKPKDKWFLNSFSYDVNLDNDLQEILKSRYLDGDH